VPRPGHRHRIRLFVRDHLRQVSVQRFAGERACSGALT
jgi:hypothetical protein